MSIGASVGREAARTSGTPSVASEREKTLLLRLSLISGIQYAKTKCGRNRYSAQFQKEMPAGTAGISFVPAGALFGGAQAVFSTEEPGPQVLDARPEQGDEAKHHDGGDETTR